MRRYKVVFKFKGELYETLLPEGRGIADAREGIWLNKDLEYTARLDNKYWIPPSKIEYIELEFKYETVD